MKTAKTILEKKGTHVTMIGGTASVVEAARLMSAHDIGALVITEGDKAVGIITERDIIKKVVATRLVPDEVTVEDVMTKPMTCCRRDTSYAECRAVMTDKEIRHLPVVEDNRLHGMISARDLMASEVETQRDTIRQLENTIDELNEYLYTKT